MNKDSKLTSVKKLLIKYPNTKAEVLVRQMGVSKVYAYNLLSGARKALGMNQYPDGTWKLKERMQSTRPATRDEKISNPSVYEVPENEKKENWETIYVATSGQSILEGGPTEAELNGADNVNHPAHYKTGGIETIDFIEAKNLSYHLGNVVKYIARADSKGNREEDLLKARWYLNREIAKFAK
jgi:hypothetical protein